MIHLFYNDTQFSFKFIKNKREENETGGTHFEHVSQGRDEWYQNGENVRRLMKSYRALVVEDEPVFRRYFLHLLSQFRDAEIVPTHVTSAEDANALLGKGERFDIIFLDYFLPGLDGSAVVRTARLLNDATAIICISSNTDYKIALELKDLGADYYISKVDLSNQEVFDRMMRDVLSTKYEAAQNIKSGA